MPKRAQAIRRKPNISVVGSGRLGTALALALSARGYRIQAMAALRLSSARKAARLIQASPSILTSSQLDRLPPSELVFIATPDDSIAEVARRIAASQRDIVRGRTVLHTSGALSSEILKPLAEVGFHTGSLHPLVSVTDPQSGAEALRHSFYCLEGDQTALRVARSIVRVLGGQSFSIDAGNKALYHAAAVTASGHLVALFDIALEMLAHCGLSRRRARQVLLPLVQSTVANLSSKEPAQALTGTFARGDVATVRKHLAAISGRQLPGALAAYLLLGNRSLALAKAKKPNSNLDEIAGILEKRGIE